MSFLTTACASRSFRLAVFAGVSALALTLGGCASTKDEDQFATSASSSAAPSGELGYWSERYRSNPNNAEASFSYSRALLASGQRAQAVAVLQRAVLSNPADLSLKGALGNALAANGQYEEALNMFQQAHTPDRPNWRVLSAQGAVLDQMGRPQDARKYYNTALRLVPNEPSVLSNLALSYALTGDLASAEKTLKKAADAPGADARVRQNLALIVGLQGRFADSERIAARDLSAQEAQANVQTVRDMLAQQNTWNDIQGAGGQPGYGGSFAASAPTYGAPAYGAPYGTPAPGGAFAASAPAYGQPAFATSAYQQPVMSYDPHATPVPYGYVEEPAKPEKESWRDALMKKRASRND